MFTCDGGLCGRASEEELERQIALFSEDGLIRNLLDAVPSYYLILNSRRQIVYFNSAFQKLLYIENPRSIYGVRVGEALQCMNVRDGKDGCGTSKFCETCGALHSIVSSLSGTEDTQECKIIRRESEESFDFRVHSKPLNYQGESFSLFSLADIRHEKRRRILERIFYHDILNSAGALLGTISLIGMGREKVEEGKMTEFTSTAMAIAHRMVDDIKGQRDLALAENQELRIMTAIIQPKSLVEEVATAYRHHSVGKGKNILVWHPEDSDFPIVTDAALLRRVLGNLLKNALEASAKGDTVSIGWKIENRLAQFHVHNAQNLSEEVKRNIFHRSFSTKGEGRGLGTYSVKLFTERYLQGSVSIETDPLAGTTIHVNLPLALKKIRK